MSILSFPDTWLEPLGKGFCLKFLSDMESKLIQNQEENVTIFPQNNFIFRALDLVSFEDVKVLILGQDPYHSFGQANGLSFSVNKEISIPPSLLTSKIIFDKVKTHSAVFFGIYNFLNKNSLAIGSGFAFIYLGYNGINMAENAYNLEASKILILYSLIPLILKIIRE